ncbi:MAG: hypothetical protein A3F41_04195 [Coxiella sp. RIFCSPHIGHO2_12_FULL_44_14]|nr:MAG: hypothetical protein A3F41_04195 [Coxiella sp. RIFCSPHIGHO2_12_FULL_44_14]
MDQDEKTSVKYRIKSYHYDQEHGEQQLLFTIEENGSTGELRQYAHEIMVDENWQALFSQEDIKKICFAVKQDEKEGR